MPVGAAGLIIAAILAAAMSNLSAAVNSLSSSSMVDFYLRWRPSSSDREKARGSRLLAIFWTALLFFLALLSNGGGHVVEVGLSIASVAYGALLGVFLLGTLNGRSNETGAMIGMLGGLMLNIFIWRQSRPLHFAIDALSLTLPKIAWTWYVFVGSGGTYVLGSAASLCFANPRKKVHK